MVGLETMHCESVFDSDRRFNPRFAAGSESVITVDSIILSVGQATDLSFLREEDRVRTTPRGTFQVDPQTLATTAPGLFAGGDAAFGPRLIIDATADGRRAARSIHQYLQGNVRWDERVTFPVIQPRDLRDGYDATPRQECPTLSLERRMGFTEVELPFSPEQAATEGNRCLHCDDNIFLDGAAVHSVRRLRGRLPIPVHRDGRGSADRLERCRGGFSRGARRSRIRDGAGRDLVHPLRPVRAPLPDRRDHHATLRSQGRMGL